MNACAFLFDANDGLRNDGVIKTMGYDLSQNPIAENASTLEDFAKLSGFREFYKQHQPYYDSLIMQYHWFNPLSKMTSWLEQKFAREYGYYKVTFSPLVRGAHSTHRYADNGFEQTVMFVCSAPRLPKYNDAMNEMIHSRVVFTEIDHNFLNPVSAEYYDEINRIFSNRTVWAQDPQASSYYDGFSVFNEYITWAYFSIYCIEHFSSEDYEIFIPKMEDF